MPQVASLTAAFCKIPRPLSASAKHATGVLPAKHCRQAGECLFHPCSGHFKRNRKICLAGQRVLVLHMKSETRTNRCGVILHSLPLRFLV